MINISKLYKKQKELDEVIAKNHNVSYETTVAKRFLALFVELGELANATRCFKYWSYKGSEPREIVGDEYADGLHFFLSLGIPLGAKKMRYDLAFDKSTSISEQFDLVFVLVGELRKNYTRSRYYKAFQSFITLGVMLDFKKEDIFHFYLAKLEENKHRQDSNY